MKKITEAILLFVLGIGMIFLISCNYYGTQKVTNNSDKNTIYLNKGQKLVDVDWRVLSIDAQVETSTWYLTRPMTASDTAVTYTYTCGGDRIITIVEQK